VVRVSYDFVESKCSLHEAIDSRFSDADHGFIVKATQIVV
jgi:hypothetical protein